MANKWLDNKYCENWKLTKEGYKISCQNKGIVGMTRSAAKSLLLCAKCAEETTQAGFIIDLF